MTCLCDFCSTYSNIEEKMCHYKHLPALRQPTDITGFIKIYK